MEENRKEFLFHEWTLFPPILEGVVLTHGKNTYWKELYLGGDLGMFSHSYCYASSRKEQEHIVCHIV